MLPAVDNRRQGVHGFGCRRNGCIAHGEDHHPRDQLPFDFRQQRREHVRGVETLPDIQVVAFLPDEKAVPGRSSRFSVLYAKYCLRRLLAPLIQARRRKMFSGKK